MIIDAPAPPVDRRRVEPPARPPAARPPGDRPDDVEEISWVTAARGGDRVAFARLHRRYARTVHGVVLARVPARDVDDVVQDVFVTALERLSALRDAAAFGPWLCAIARSRSTDHLRRRAPREHEALPDEEALRAAGVPAVVRAQASEALEAVRALPEAYRETLVLRLVEGLTGPEIADRTGLTPGSVRVNLHRGMKLLRERLGGDA